MNLPTPQFVSSEDEVLGPMTTYEEYDAAVQHFKDKGAHEIWATAVEVVCDFCSHPRVLWLYVIEPGGVVIVKDTPTGREFHGDADGRWGACEECHKLIQSGEWEDLARRSLKMFKQTHPDNLMATDTLLLFSITASHDFFRGMWKGNDPERVQTDAELLSGKELQ